MKKLALHTLMQAANLAFVSLLFVSSQALSGSLDSVIDDFNHEQTNSLGLPRMFLSDQSAGGKSTAETSVDNGVLKVKGEILPPRGQPGWSSSILPLGPMGEGQDASGYEGVRLVVKIHQGMLSISANSTDVTNFDYHSALVVAAADGKFHEVKVPFNSMKQMWSEPTALNTKNLNSLSIVAFSMQKASYSFEIQEVSFY